MIGFLGWIRENVRDMGYEPWYGFSVLSWIAFDLYLAVGPC